MAVAWVNTDWVYSGLIEGYADGPSGYLADKMLLFDVLAIEQAFSAATAEIGFDMAVRGDTFGIAAPVSAFGMAVSEDRFSVAPLEIGFITEIPAGGA